MTAQLGWISSMAVASAAVLLGLAWFGQLYGFVFGRRAAVGQETAAGAPFGAHVPEPAGTRATAEAPSAAVVPVSAGAAAVGAAPGIAGQPALVGAPGTAAEAAPAEAPESWRSVRTGSLEATPAPARTAQDLPSLPVRISGPFRRLAAAFLVAGCLARGLAAGRVPWANLYEFAITTTATLVVGLVIIERRRPALRLGLVVPAVAVIMLGLALTVYVPVAPLVPALRSYWLVLHVLAAATSGACFVLAGIVSVIFLVGGRRRPVDAGRQTELDRLAVRLTAFAFPIWTFGALIAGPIWAEYAWGRYWGWDPKEVWALVTWIVFAAYLHARATAGWRGRRAAVLAVIGALSFVFNYVGVNLFFAGLHAYSGI